MSAADDTDYRGMPIRRQDYVIQPRDIHRARRADFDSGIRQNFLRDTAALHEGRLRAVGLRDRDIELMSRGIVPPGWDVHHKLPLDGGGLNTPDNFILMRRDIHEKLHQDYLDPQVDSLYERFRNNRQINRMRMRLPWPEGPVHDPASLNNKASMGMQQTLAPRSLAAR